MSKSVSNIFFKISLLLSILLLSACGGSGGGGGDNDFSPPNISNTKVIISTENQEEVANTSQNGVSGSASSGGFSSSIGVVMESTDGVSSKGVFDFVRGSLMERLQNSDLSQVSVATGVIYESDDACTNGGRERFTADITNINSYTMVVGDTISGSYTNCLENSETLNGSIAMEVTYGNFYLDCIECNDWIISINFNNFQTTEVGAATETFHGDVTLSHSGMTDSLSGNSLYLLVAGGDSIRITNFDISLMSSGNIETFTGSMTVASSLLNGAVSISIDPNDPLKSYVNADYPISGTMTVTGQGGSTLIIRAISETEVQLSLDADNDGQTDAGYPQVTTWSDIQSQTGDVF